MSQNNHVIKFSLDRETIKKFMSVKGATLEKRNDRLEVVFPDSRIKLEADKKEPTTATYYNNKSSNLHFLGPTVTAKATHVLVDKKESEKTRGVELLDIPSIHTPTSPIKPKLKKPSSTLKTNNSSNNNNNTKKANIPPPPRRSVTPQNTPRPSSNNPHLEKLSDRVIQLLAIKPYQITTMAKALETTSWDIKRIVDDVGICIPDQSSQKKKYCLKPQLYKNVRIWDWPLYTETEKDTVYANAKEAYDILQLPPDAIERANLTSDHRSRPHSSDHRYATTTTTTTKKKSSLKKEEKKSVGVVDIKGKGKSHGYPAAVAAVESVARTTPSPITTSPTSLPPLPSLPPSLPVQQTLSSSTSSSSATSVTPLVRSPLKTKASARNGLLKPSSSNRKVSTKTSQIYATSPPPPPPTTAPPALPPPPPRPVSCFVPSMAYVTPNVQKRKEE
ncbi:uncharacterized protein EV154DRAFT_52282 [Mucor mucedo]|uniref:uncharacterized protein n=1 Tax=Mucor mucedo TaxID=29922 RepID=UPI00221F7852|nr:uncharacterized protein EV154DRAFT_52282 [Mucor mucedo]KAI7879542.1 hypothetical protein EV154DRAFT_52282 [Mucor mucedo]